jgi:hypothetical protein
MNIRILAIALILSLASTSLGEFGRGPKERERQEKENVLYIWAQDEAHVAPDFLAVIDFDEQSPRYGKVINVVPVPPPGNTTLIRTRPSWLAGGCSAC